MTLCVVLCTTYSAEVKVQPWQGCQLKYSSSSATMLSFNNKTWSRTPNVHSVSTSRRSVLKKDQAWYVRKIRCPSSPRSCLRLATGYRMMILGATRQKRYDLIQHELYWRRTSLLWGSFTALPSFVTLAGRTKKTSTDDKGRITRSFHLAFSDGTQELACAKTNKPSLSMSFRGNRAHYHHIILGVTSTSM